MPGTPISDRSGPESYEVIMASLCATLHRLQGLLHAVDVDCRLQVALQPALARIDNQETPV